MKEWTSHDEAGGNGIQGEVVPMMPWEIILAYPGGKESWTDQRKIPDKVTAFM
ncbi:MAG: hypothetical protein ACLTER_12865 [Ruminococcus sp.]